MIRSSLACSRKNILSLALQMYKETPIRYYTMSLQVANIYQKIQDRTIQVLVMSSVHFNLKKNLSTWNR